MRGVLAVILICIGLSVASAPAAAGDFEIYGTNEGTLSRDECPKGTYFVGVVGNAGNWLDQISVVCATPRPDGTFGGAKSLSSRGGTGGALQKALCPPDSAVSSISVSRNRDYHLTSLEMTCKNVKTWLTRSVARFRNVTTYIDFRSNSCSAGELGTGLSIRWGEFVNGLGLICGTFTGPPAALCAAGMVWRERFDGDTVCVKPEERYRLADGTCRSGYVWRDSYRGDNVCVTPAQRDAAKAAAAKSANKPVKATGKAKTDTGTGTPQIPQQEFVEVLQSVDLYSKPGGDDRDKIGSLDKGTAQVTLIGSQAPWYDVKWPGHEGWVYSGSGWVSLKLP